MESNIQNQIGISDSFENNEIVIDEPVEDNITQDIDANVSQEIDTNIEDESITSDDAISESTKEEQGEDMPVFERDDWQDKVSKFTKEYPISGEFIASIGDEILEDDNLWNDEACLEKAMLKVLCKQFTSDGDKANDEEFLANYIYNNEAIKGKIVDEYLENLSESKLPSAMNRGGRISLTNASKPTSIREAGYLAERMMRR